VSYGHGVAVLFSAFDACQLSAMPLFLFAPNGLTASAYCAVCQSRLEHEKFPQHQAL
jgi:hypothetical protein